MKNLLTILVLCLAINANAQKMTIDSVLHNKAWEVSYLPDSSLCLYQPSMREMINKRKKEIDEEIAQYKKEGKNPIWLEKSKKEIYFVEPWRVHFFDRGDIIADNKNIITPLGKKTKELFVMSLSCGVAHGIHGETDRYVLNPAKDSITIISKQYRLDTTSRYTERYRTLQECWCISTRQYKIKVVNKRKTIFIYNPKSLKIDFDKAKCENAIIERSKIIKEKELEGTWYFIQPNNKIETYRKDYRMDYGNASKIDFLPNKTTTLKIYSQYEHDFDYSKWQIKDNKLIWEVRDCGECFLRTYIFEILDYNNSGVLLLKKIAYDYYYMNLPDTFKMCKNKEYLYALEGEEYSRQRQLNIKPEIIGYDPYPYPFFNWISATTLTPTSNYKWFVTVPTPAIVALPYKNNYKLRLDAVIKNPKYKKGKTCYYINKTAKYKEYKIDKNAKYYTLKGKEDIKENSLKTFFKLLNVEDEVLYFNFNIVGNTIQGIYEIRK